MENTFDKRISDFRRELISRADAAIIASDINRTYLSGFASTAGILMVTRSCAYLLLDFRYYEKAINYQKSGLIAGELEICRMNSRIEDIKKILKDENANSILYENEKITCSEFDKMQNDFCAFEFVKADCILDRQRSIKDEYELSKIKEAQKLTDAAFSHILTFIGKDMTENEIALELEFFMRKNGAQNVAFDTICVSGKKSSQPHGTPGDEKISGFLTMDFGAKLDGYCSDMTRTICIGTPSDEMKSVYNTVIDAQNAAFSKIRAGEYGKEIDRSARDLIYKAGFEGCFGHGLGHSVGLEIHESPCFSPSEKEVIPANAVVSVEPGIYLENRFGVRIEDLVVVKDGGYENITKSSKELIIV